MKTNLQFFDYSKEHPEDLFDSFYAKNKVVIPSCKEEENQLTKNHEKMLKLITAFHVLDDCYQKEEEDETVQNIVKDIITILDKTPYINYSAFTQFFMVHNATYSIYRSLPYEKKRIFIYEMLKKYCQERHEMYASHGYSNTVLQVMCDNYSHKRNSKSGIEKVLEILKPYGLKRLQCVSDLDGDDYYFLPDKGDKKIFEEFLTKYSLKMESRNIEQNKLPDLVFKHKGHYYVCELKTMKEGGGGQNKQVVEIAYFIKFSEESKNVHYITFLDCNYSNVIFHDNSPKIAKQRQDIVSALEKNEGNYFLNTAGLIEFVKEIF